VHQSQTNACRRMTSPDPRNKVCQIRGRNVHWPDA